MADSAATKDSSGIAKSFADRLTFPGKANGTPTDGKFDWAEDASTPVQEKAEIQAAAPAPTSQEDGTLELAGGSQLSEPEFDVNVKLADMQEDPNNPLYSVKTFEELNL